MAKTKTKYVIGVSNGRFVVTKDKSDRDYEPDVFMSKESRVTVLRSWHLPDAEDILKFSSKLRAKTFYKKHQEFFSTRDFVIMPYNQNLLNSILYLKIVGL